MPATSNLNKVKNTKFREVQSGIAGPVAQVAGFAPDGELPYELSPP